MHQRDYLLRLIQQTGQMPIRLRSRLLGRQASAEEVERPLLSVARSTGFDLGWCGESTPDGQGESAGCVTATSPRTSPNS